MKTEHDILETLFERLYSTYGPQQWWPAESAFEIMVGAILVQNTAWTNVEQAIQNLRQADALNAHSILNLPVGEIARLIRPSGCFNIKAQRLKNFISWFNAQGGYNRLAELNTADLRSRLLGVNGIGPETADDILLYAFERPVFVVDSYTRRLLTKLGLIGGGEPYQALQHYFEDALEADVRKFNEYHALIVRHAREKCTGKPDCRHCYIERPVAG